MYLDQNDERSRLNIVMNYTYTIETRRYKFSLF